MERATETDVLRIYLAGSVCIERGGTVVHESRLPGRQGRLAFAILAADREHAHTKEELAGELWPEEQPTAWEVALRALVSKLRGVLAEVDLDGQTTLASALGAYQLRLPADAWVDVDAAADALHQAETAATAGDEQDAMGWALVANAIARRGFLPGEDGPWASRVRARLQDVRVRALECRSLVLRRRGQFEAAARDAQLVIDEEPFRETAHALLMRARAEGGNPAEALRAYERCRRLLSEELGVDPSPATETLYLEILRSA